MYKKSHIVCARHRNVFLKSLFLTCLASYSSLAWSDQKTPEDIQNSFEQQRVIVVLHEKSNSSQNSESVENVIQQYTDSDKDIIHHKYKYLLSGFAGTLSSNVVAALQSDSRVEHIEIDSDNIVLQAEQNDSSWNLDRIDQTNNLLDSTYHYENDGTGVNAYILDSGIRSTHEDFEGRIASGVSFVAGDSSAEDCRGHGTRVAGVLGGKTYGVAKNITMHSVRIFSCEGTTNASTIIAGMEWIVDNHQKPAIVNMSFNSSAGTAFDEALGNLIDAGVTIFTGAGNSSSDACNSAPSSYPDVITIASTDEFDQKRATSGFGPCVALFAPGTNILTANHTSDTASGLRNGSSFASPHAAGVAALFLQDNPNASPADVREHLVSNAIEGIVGDAGEGSPNLFLYSPYGRVVHIRKRNAPDFALDGGRDGANGQNIYLWSQNSNNVNQQWIETDLGDGYFSYQKQNTNYCIDGGKGGSLRQNVYLWTCNTINQNQHWKKVDAGSGYFKLVKRNAPAYTLDGGSNGENRQNVRLHDTSNTSQNLHWDISE